MSIEEAIKIKDIAERYLQFKKTACDYQDIISGKIEEFTITTKNGSITIPSETVESFGNSVLFEIDSLFGDYLDKIESELKTICE